MRNRFINSTSSVWKARCLSRLKSSPTSSQPATKQILQARKPTSQPANCLPALPQSNNPKSLLLNYLEKLQLHEIFMKRKKRTKRTYTSPKSKRIKIEAQLCLCVLKNSINSYFKYYDCEKAR